MQFVRDISVTVSCVYSIYVGLTKYFSYIPLFLVGRVLGGSYKINSLGSWGISTKAFKIWRGGKCSVVVPPTLHVIFIFDSHSTVSAAQSVAARYAPPGYGDPANLGSRPRLVGSLCQVILNSRAK